ncbi:unnamed protein product [Vicia faba]|uniref:FAF domain-containing protein n=1 Tax=Vicia faba TaxID=3906 RepID=A0AAV0YDI6_VICFA|nr:unnamed protein product [Vicia faba]
MSCSLQQIFENPPLPAESPTVLLDQSLSSWKNQIKPMRHSSSFTEIFGELCSESITPQTSPLPSPSLSSSSSFPELKLSICTKSVEEYKQKEDHCEEKEEDGEGEKNEGLEGKWLWESGNAKEVNEYPPPISCIGRSGKLCVSFVSYRNNGRFVLKQVQIPTRDFLHAHREDGRLTLHFVQHDGEEQEFLGDEEDYDSGVESNIDEEEQHCEGHVKRNN